MSAPAWLRAWVVAGSIVGVADLTAACLHAGAYGAKPTVVFRAVASGLLGREAAFAGGAWVAALGVFLHFVIAFGAAGVYLLASRRLPWLLEWPVPAGIAYGVAVYFFMQKVVLPLSAFTQRPQSAKNMAIAIGIHIVCVGLPIGLAIARLAPLVGSRK